MSDRLFTLFVDVVFVPCVIAGMLLLLLIYITNPEVL